MNIRATNNMPSADSPLQQQRLALRVQLANQRQVIEARLGPVQTVSTRLYPRSKTMRFFTQRPELMKKLLGLMIGASFIKSMHPVLTIAKFLHSSAKPRW